MSRFSIPLDEEEAYYRRLEDEYFSTPEERAAAEEAESSRRANTTWGGEGFRQIGEIAKPIALALEKAGEIGPSCESPIEVQLGARLLAELKPPFRLEPQYWLGRFRMDFAVIRDGLPCLFIECDGKAFHSSEDQIANDLEKDRAAARSGIPLLRFTGSNIFRRPDECARQIITLLEGLG